MQLLRVSPEWSPWSLAPSNALSARDMGDEPWWLCLLHHLYETSTVSRSRTCDLSVLRCPAVFQVLLKRQRNKRFCKTLPWFSYICWWGQLASRKLSDAVFASRHANVSSLWRLLLYVFLKSPHLWVKFQDEMMTALACSCIHQRWLSDAVLITLP